MEVGDLVRTTRTGAGIGDTWTRPGVMCVVTKINGFDSVSWGGAHIS